MIIISIINRSVLKVLLKTFNIFIKIIKRIQSKKKNYVNLVIDNKKYTININNINYIVPDIRDIKIPLINYHLKDVSLNNSYRIHLFNYLFKADKNFHYKACLIKYLMNKKFNIREISAQFLSKYDIPILNEFNLKIDKLKSKRFFRFKLLKNTLAMIMLNINRVLAYYRDTKFFPKQRSKYDLKIKYYYLLRAWVDLAENIYVNKLNKTLDNTIIHVSPNIKNQFPTERQQKYLEYLKRNHRNYFFYIPKINYKKALMHLMAINLSNVPNILKIPLMSITLSRYEIDDHVEYIIKKFPDIRTVYTKEEYKTNTTYYTNKFHEYNIRVINFNHGLGVYFPIVNYDVFYLFNKLQRDFFIGSSEFRYFKSDLKLANKFNQSKKKIALFFIGIWILTSRKSRALALAYKEIIDYMDKITRDLKIPVYAKYHPSSTELDKILSDKIKIIEDIKDLPSKYKYIATTFYSSYSIDLLEIMPFLIINPHGILNTKYFFPQNDLIYVKDYDEFKEKIKKFIDTPNYYYDYWEALISIFKENLG